MAGYYEYSMSNNAVAAYRNGLMPATKLASHLRKKGFRGITAEIIKRVLKADEWHHTSKMYNAVNFYSIQNVYENRRCLRQAMKIRQDQVKIFFKSWNFWQEIDPRKIDWKITNRNGNHIVDFNKVKEKINKLLMQNFRNRHQQHKTQRRIAKESIKVCVQILRTIKKEGEN